MQTENYDIYFPIQLWVSHRGYYRLQPPLLGIPDTYEFPLFFWRDPYAFASNETRVENGRVFISETLDQQMQKEWSLQTTFWAFNPNSGMYLNRGFFPILVTQRRVYPFDSRRIRTTDGPLPLFSQETLSFPYHIFAFYVYSVKIPDTSLLFLQKKEDSLVIRICHGECPFEPHLAFLPSREGKQISCYELYGSENGIFAYVFRDRPRGSFFRRTLENICIPSSDPSDYPCFFDCMKASFSPRVLSGNIYTESSNQALQTVMYTFPTVSAPWWKRNHLLYLPSLLLFLMVSIFVGRLFVYVR